MSLSNIEPEKTLLEKLKEACKDVWHEYTHPEFIDQLQDGTLDIEKFRYYLKQDYLYLLHYTKCFALMAYKGETLKEIQFALKGTLWITEGELELHSQYKKRGIETHELEESIESIECIAYTRYMKDVGMSGDYLDIMIAIASCYIGYGEIGQRLLADEKTVLEGNPYKEWILMYGGEDYKSSTIEFIETLNSYAEDLSKKKLEKLKFIFGEVTRLEVAFWDMGMRGNKAIK
ncbi:thiaminase II [Psychrilyobacter sp.]|uniref:thiaminase II n=1 Tax=Psychrilyobacter sp. TaxID=2586924 RepID=UPI0030165653